MGQPPDLGETFHNANRTWCRHGIRKVDWVAYGELEKVCTRGCVELDEREDERAACCWKSQGFVSWTQYAAVEKR